jgi:hypothetical protein
MQSSEILSLRSFTKECETILAKSGMTLSIGRDFEIFNFYANNSDKNTPIDPIFQSSGSDIDEVDGLWVIGMDAHDNTVQTQAVRFLNMDNNTLSHFFKTRLYDIRPAGYEVDTVNTKWRLSSQASNISGRVCYHGGLWIREDFRGGSMAAILTRYMIAKALLELEPDFFIGLQSPSVGLRGLSAKEGYMKLEQRAILWAGQDQRLVLEDWLVWMSQEEAIFNLAVPAQNIVELLEKKTGKLLKSA